MKQRLAFLPGPASGFGGLLHGQAIGQTSVMVRVKDQQHTFRAANRQLVGGRVGLSLFSTVSRVGAGQQPFEVAAKTFQRGGVVAVTNKQ